VILRLLIGTFSGGLSGYAVYHFIGCGSGACPITSNPWTSIFVGVLLGLMIAGGK